MIGTRTPSIAKNLTLSLLVVIGLLSLMFIGIYYYQISKNTEWQLEKTADRYIESIAGTLEVPLWDMDREHINTICSYYIQNDWVVMVALTSSSGEVMFRKNTMGREDEGRFIKRSRDMFYGGETIGRVEIVLNSRDFYREKLRSLKGTIAVLLICCAGLIVCTGFLLKKFIKEPIAVLGRVAESYAKGDYHPDVDITPYKEFNTFAAALFKMGDTIEAQMNELKKAEEALRKHRDSLEDTVATRTQELAASNTTLHKEIQQRKQAEEALRVNEKRLDAILRSSPVGIGLVVNERLGWANETLYLMVGYGEDELLHKKVDRLFQDREVYERYVEAFTKSDPKSSANSLDTRWVRKDGSAFECNVRAYPLDTNDLAKGQIIAVADISDRKASEQALREKDRLQGVLELSGAISHEMNQPLMGAMGYFDLILMTMEKDDPNIERIHKIKTQLDRMANITKKLMDISDYRTKDYLDGRIVDLSKSSDTTSDEP